MQTYIEIPSRLVDFLVYHIVQGARLDQVAELHCDYFLRLLVLYFYPYVHHNKPAVTV